MTAARLAVFALMGFWVKVAAIAELLLPCAPEKFWAVGLWADGPLGHAGVGFPLPLCSHPSPP